MNQIADVFAQVKCPPERIGTVRDAREGAAEFAGNTAPSRHRPRRKWTADDHAAFMKMQAAGLMLKQIAAHFDVCTETMRRRAGRWNSGGGERTCTRYPECIKHPLLQAMTPHWRRVLLLVIEGNLTKQAAWGIGITPRTAESHRKRAFQALQARNTADAVRISCTTSIYAELQQEFRQCS
jgi:FixJ family two-component response regulator